MTQGGPKRAPKWAPGTPGYGCCLGNRSPGPGSWMLPAGSRLSGGLGGTAPQPNHHVLCEDGVWSLGLRSREHTWVWLRALVPRAPWVLRVGAIALEALGPRVRYPVGPLALLGALGFPLGPIWALGALGPLGPYFFFWFLGPLGPFGPCAPWEPIRPPVGLGDPVGKA